MRWVLRRWTDLPLRSKGLVVVALPVAGLLAAIVLGYSVQQRTNEEQDAIRDIGRVRSQVGTVLTLLLDAETAVRGYVISEDESFLRPYSAAFDRLPGALASLEDLVGEDPMQLSRAQRVRILAGRALELFAEVRSQGEGEREPRGLRSGNLLMEQLRAELLAMEDAEESRLQEQLTAIEDAERTQTFIFILVILFGLIGGILAIVLFTTGIAHRIDMISESAGRLSSGEPLTEAPRGEDEVGRLADALGEASALLADRERRLLEAKERAEAANWAKSEFLSRTSHELRTPLTAIRGFAGFLNKQDLPDRHREAVEHMIKASDHLTGVINDILDIARIEAGKMSLELGPTSLQAITTEAVSFLRHVADDHDVSISDRVPGDAWVMADAKSLRQVLINLISNAIKYNRPGGSVSVTVATEPGKKVISVSDEGEGIPPEYLERLFVAYDRLGAENTSVRGVGLGLTISKSLVHLMNGELWAESRVGTGSTFSFEIPSAPSPTVTTISRPTDAPSEAGSVEA